MFLRCTVLVMSGIVNKCKGGDFGHDKKQEQKELKTTKTDKKITIQTKSINHKPNPNKMVTQEQ